MSDCLRVEIPEGVRLNAVGDHRKQQLGGKVRRGAPPGDAAPASLETFKVETAKMRDLVVYRSAY